MSDNEAETGVSASSQPVDEVLRAQLGKYRKKALDLGASAAEIISARWVQIDERVRLKCAIPCCPNYRRCANCPPHTPEPEFMRKALARYSWAILFKNDVPAKDFTDLDRYYPHGRDSQKKTDEIAAKVETAAFADGHRFALGLGAGGCRDTLCNGGMCQALDSGRCPNILKARPSMEAVGIDVFDIAGRVGWNIYPIYRSIASGGVPSGTSVGLVLIE